MYNILGSQEFEGEYQSPNISERDVFLKMYCKKNFKTTKKVRTFEHSWYEWRIN